MNYYIEVLFVGPLRNRGTQVFKVSFEEFDLVRKAVRELEDPDDTPPALQPLIKEILSRDPVPMATGDLRAVQKSGQLFTMERR